jgi:hypothetical protein
MSKVAGLKGRSPETYDSPHRSGIVTTTAQVNGSPVSLSTVLASLLIDPIALAAGHKNIIAFSGTLVSPSPSAGVTVNVEVVVGGVVVYTISVETASSGGLANSPTPFSLVVETALSGALDIKAATVSGTASAAAGGSLNIVTT